MQFRYASIARDPQSIRHEQNEGLPSNVRFIARSYLPTEVVEESDSAAAGHWPRTPGSASGSDSGLDSDSWFARAWSLAGGFRHLSADIGLGKEQPPSQNKEAKGLKKGPLDVRNKSKF
jgi:hypothetical protein